MCKHNQELIIYKKAAKFLAAFAPTQFPLATIEGILTVVIMIGLETYAKSELKNLGIINGGEN